MDEKIEALREQIDALVSENGSSQASCEAIAKNIAEIYSINTHIADYVWNDILNRYPKRKQLYLVSVYRRLVDLCGIERAVEILSVDRTRIRGTFIYANKGTNLVFRAYEIISIFLSKNKYDESVFIIQLLGEFCDNKYDGINKLLKYLENCLFDREYATYYRAGINRMMLLHFYDMIIRQGSVPEEFHIALIAKRCLYSNQACKTKDFALKCISYACEYRQYFSETLFINHIWFNDEEISQLIDDYCNCAENYRYRLLPIANNHTKKIMDISTEELCQWIIPFLLTSSTANSLLIKDRNIRYCRYMIKYCVNKRMSSVLIKQFFLIYNVGDIEILNDLLNEMDELLYVPEKIDTRVQIIDGSIKMTMTIPEIRLIIQKSSDYINDIEEALWLTEVFEQTVRELSIVEHESPIILKLGRIKRYIELRNEGTY